MIISLEEFLGSYPEGLVPLKSTGHEMDYGANPYTGYDDPANVQPRLFSGEVDPRLPAMERVMDIHVNGKFKIYPLSLIGHAGVINDRFEDRELVIFYTSKTVSVLDERQISESKEIGSVTVFSAVLEDRQLTFHKNPDGFIDEQSGSVWSITGQFIAGNLKGKSLKPLIHGNHFAFAWFAFHPDSEIHE